MSGRCGALQVAVKPQDPKPSITRHPLYLSGEETEDTESRGNVLATS